MTADAPARHADPCPDEAAALAAEPATPRTPRIDPRKGRPVRRESALDLIGAADLACRVPLRAMCAASGLTEPTVRSGLAKMGMRAGGLPAFVDITAEDYAALNVLAERRGRETALAHYVADEYAKAVRRKGGLPIDPSALDFVHAPDVAPSDARHGATPKLAKLDPRRLAILTAAHAALGLPDLSATIAAIWPRDPADPSRLIPAPARPIIAGRGGQQVTVAGPVCGSPAVCAHPVAPQVRGALDLWAAARGEG